jgi:hypothetical protein
MSVTPRWKRSSGLSPVIFLPFFIISVEDVSSVYSVSSDYSDEVYKNFNNTKNTTLVNESNITENINPILCDNSIDPIQNGSVPTVNKNSLKDFALNV